MRALLWAIWFAGRPWVVEGKSYGDRSVLVATTDQLTAALALIELDGVARRLVLCPPDSPLEHLPFIMEAAAVDAIVSDRSTLGPNIPPSWMFHHLQSGDRA